METSLGHAGDGVGIINPVEVGHGLGIIERDRTIVVGHSKHVTILSMI